ncbi:MAG: EpsG family protein [Thermodesulfovibrio sp.]|nr:EpsG family protein [Thermodesulfovibrio sp.]
MLPWVYTRQAVALGLILGFIASLYKDKIKQSFIFFLLALLFHESALIASVLYLRNIVGLLSIKRLALYFVILSLSLLVLYFLYYERLYYLVNVYFFEKMKSSGALIRILLNFLSIFFLLIFYSRWQKIFHDFIFWLPFAVISIFLLFFAIITGATTIADRLLLYFYPIQIVVFTRLQLLLPYGYLRFAYALFVIVLYLAVLLVWLFFAVHRNSWMPYNNLLFVM